MAEDLRYGTSALDIKHRSNAVKDELLLNNNDGKMYYKRDSDGQIVTYEEQKYTKATLAADMQLAINNYGVVDVDDNHAIIYYTTDISGMNNMKETEVQPLNGSDYGINDMPIIIKGERGFFIRVRGNYNTNSIVSMLSSMNVEDNNAIGEDVKITIAYRVTKYIDGVPQTPSDQDHTCVYNTLTFIPIEDDSLDDDSDVEYRITITSVKFTNFRTLYNSFISNTANGDKIISTKNLDNPIIECDNMDLVYYTNIRPTVASAYTENCRRKFEFSIPVQKMNNDYMSSESIIIAKDKPSHKCIWGEILN